MNIPRHLKGLLAHALPALAAALALAALLIGTLRLALPLADGQRERILETVSERLGHPLRAESLSLRLVGWTPRLTLKGVVLADTAGGPDALRLKALELDLDLAGSLALGSPQVSALTLVGAQLSIRRLTDGRIRLDGLQALEIDDPRTRERFLSQGRISLIDTEMALIDEQSGLALPHLSAVRLRLHNQGRRHRLELSAQILAPGARGASGRSDSWLDLLADLSGAPSGIADWAGALYLRLGGADLTTLLAGLLPPELAVTGENTRIETWARLEQGRLAGVLARMALQDLHLRLGPAAPSIPERSTDLHLDRLSTLLRVTRRTAGWSLGLRDLGLSLTGGNLPSLDLSMDLDLDLGPDLGMDLSAGLTPRRLVLVSGPLDLEGLGQLIAPLTALAPRPLPPALELLPVMAPSGRVERLALTVDRPKDATTRWRLGLLAQDLAIRRTQRLPGFSGLDLRAQADEKGGTLALGSEGLHLDLAPGLDHELTLDQLSGRLGWTLDDSEGLTLTGRNLVIENSDLAGRARFRLELPGTGTQPNPGPFLDLRASFHDGNGANVRPYLPVGIVHPDLVLWLTRAIRGGRILQADLVLRGPLKQYPFREHQGRFELLMDLDDARLDYLEGWPPIASATASLHFLNQGLSIRLDSGRLLDSDLSQGQAAIPDLWGARVLSIHGEAAGPFQDGLRILGETPLADHLGPLARALSVSGGSHLALDLGVPLRKGEPLTAKGRLTWPGPAEVSLRGTPLTLTGLRGALEFTEKSVRVDALDADLWGRPARLSIVTRHPGDDQNAVTEIRAQASSTVDALAEHLPSPSWALASGELQWELALDLRNADLRRPDPTLALNLASDLSGLALDLPDPWAKTTGESRPLRLSGALVPGRSLGLTGGLQGPHGADLGLDLTLDLGLGGLRLERGRIRLGAAQSAGDTPVPGPSDTGLLVYGTLAAVDLGHWSDWWNDTQERLVKESAQTPTSPLALSADLRIEHLSLGWADLSAARIRAERHGDGWGLAIESRELAGRIDLSNGGTTPLDLALERLDLAALTAGVQARDATAPAPSDRPARRLPALDLRIDDLSWGEAGLGQLHLGLRPGPSGVSLHGIDFHGPGDTRITGEATWSEGAGANPGGLSQLTLKIRSRDPGPLLKALDYAQALSQTPIESNLRLEWPGGLEDFALANAEGDIDLKTGAGRLLQVDPGLGRVLGFLNLGALSRRLELDFTDLYQEGLAFEGMTGDIRVGDGRAQLRQFRIDGPASVIHISGFTNLRARTFDQTVTVEPSLGGSVALAGAVAGGPLVGAAVLLVDKVTGGVIDKLGRYQYRVQGPWADPQLTRLGWEPFVSPGPAQEEKPAGSREASQDGKGDLRAMGLDGPSPADSGAPEAPSGRPEMTTRPRVSPDQGKGTPAPLTRPPTQAPPDNLFLH